MGKPRWTLQTILSTTQGIFIIFSSGFESSLRFDRQAAGKRLRKETGMDYSDVEYGYEYTDSDSVEYGTNYKGEDRLVGGRTEKYISIIKNSMLPILPRPRPWMSLIRIISGPRKKVANVCGGTLINHR